MSTPTVKPGSIVVIFFGKKERPAIVLTVEGEQMQCAPLVGTKLDRPHVPLRMNTHEGRLCQITKDCQAYADDVLWMPVSKLIRMGYGTAPGSVRWKIQAMLAKPAD